MNEVKIFVDTNVLLHFTDYKLDFTEDIGHLISKQFAIYIHPYVEAELINLLTDHTKLAKKSKLAMNFISRFRSYEDTSRYSGTDTALLSIAKETAGCVLTFDKDLRDRCLQQGIPVIAAFKKGRLQLLGHLE